jgi:peptidase E
MSNQRPVYLMAGGGGGRGRGSDSIIESIMADIGKTLPVIAYVGSASDDDKDFFKYIGTVLQKAGAGEVVHALTVPKRADIKKAREVLKAADAVFISGGDVERGMQVLEQRDLIVFLGELFQQGKLFFGASAGSIMLAKEWVRWRNPDDDSTAELFPCLGFAPVICDTHAELDRWQELQAALQLEKENTRGYGIATGTCLKVFPDSKVEALGEPICQYIHHMRKVERLPDLQPIRD